MSAYHFEAFSDGAFYVTDSFNGDAWEWTTLEIVGFPPDSEIVVRVSLCDSKYSNLFANSVEGAADIRKDMKKWLEENGYSASLACDFSDKASIEAATAEAKVVTDRFFAGDYAPFDALWCASWVSEDGQGSIDAEGQAERPDPAAFVAGLLADFGGTADDRDCLLAGRINLTRYRGHWNRGPEILEDEGFDVADFAPLPAAA